MEDELWMRKIKERLDDYSEPLPVSGWERLEKDLSVSIYWQIFGKCHGYWKKTVIVLSDYIS